MSVKRPQKPLGKSIALKNAQKRLQSKSSRMAYASLNLTAMVDMFTLLTIFLLANFSATGEILFMSKDIELPKAQATAELNRAPVVSISPKAVSLEGTQVAFTEDVLNPKTTDVTPLTDKLREVRRAQDLQNPGKFTGTLILQCDQEVNFSVVRKVMYAAAEAGYTDISHAVLRKAGAAAPEGEGAAPAGEVTSTLYAS